MNESLKCPQRVGAKGGDRFSQGSDVCTRNVRVLYAFCSYISLRAFILFSKSFKSGSIVNAQGDEVHVASRVGVAVGETKWEIHTRVWSWYTVEIVRVLSVCTNTTEYDTVIITYHEITTDALAIANKF